MVLSLHVFLMAEYDERSTRRDRQRHDPRQIASTSLGYGHQGEAVYTGFSNLPLDVQLRRDERIFARFEDDEFDEDELEDTQTVESASRQSDAVASNYLDAGWGEIANTENLEETTEAEAEVAQEVLAGALMGDFNNDPTFWSDIGQIVTGLIPIAGQLGDARDLIHALDDIFNKEGFKKVGSWAALVLIVIGFIPGVGDAIKSIGRRGIRYLDNNGIIKRIGQWLGNNVIAPLLNGVGDLTAPLIDQIRNTIRRKLDEAQQIARQLGEGANNVIDDVTGQGQPRLATEGVENVNQPNQIRGSSNSNSGGFSSGALNQLNENSSRVIQTWTSEEIFSVSNLLQKAADEGDDEMVRLVEQTIQRSPQNARNKVTQLASTMAKKPEVPENFSLGRLFGSGGQNDVFEMAGDSGLLIKKSQGGARGGRALAREYRALLKIEMTGIQTAAIKKAELNGETVLILEKIGGAISKEIDNNIQEYGHLVTQKTVDDLEQIYKKLQDNEMDVGDFQFMVSEIDGSVTVVDPQNVRPDTPPSNRIRRIIDRFKSILDSN